MTFDELAVMFRWLQREAAMNWRSGGAAPGFAPGDASKAAAINYGKIALYIEQLPR